MMRSMIRVIGENHLVDSWGFASGVDIARSRLERAGFETRNTVEFIREGSQFNTGMDARRAMRPRPVRLPA